MDHLHDEIDILVRRGVFLGQTLPASGAGDDALAFQFLIDSPAVDHSNSRVTAQHSARAVAGGGARLAPPRPPPTAQNSHGARPMSPGIITGCPIWVYAGGTSG